MHAMHVQSMAYGTEKSKQNEATRDAQGERQWQRHQTATTTTTKNWITLNKSALAA